LQFNLDKKSKIPDDITNLKDQGSKIGIITLDLFILPKTSFILLYA